MVDQVFIDEATKIEEAARTGDTQALSRYAQDLQRMDWKSVQDAMTQLDPTHHGFPEINIGNGVIDIPAHVGAGIGATHVEAPPVDQPSTHGEQSLGSAAHQIEAPRR